MDVATSLISRADDIDEPSRSGKLILTKTFPRMKNTARALIRDTTPIGIVRSDTMALRLRSKLARVDIMPLRAPSYEL